MGYSLLVVFSALSAVCAYVVFLSYRDLRNFLARHGAIESDAALADFKNLARGNMKAAAVMIPILVSWALLGLYIFATQSVLEGAIVLVVSTLMTASFRKVKRAEKSSRSLRCDPGLRAEYDRISQTWVGKAWPDF